MRQRILALACLIGVALPVFWYFALREAKREAAPAAPRLGSPDAAGTQLLRDELGVVHGGIRTPWVDAPSAVLSGDPPGGDGFLQYDFSDIENIQHISTIPVGG